MIELKLYHVINIIQYFFSNPIPLEMIDNELFEFYELCIKLLFEQAHTNEFIDNILTLLCAAKTGSSETCKYFLTDERLWSWFEITMKKNHDHDLEKYYLKAAITKGLLQQVINILALYNTPKEYNMPTRERILYVALLEACAENQVDICKLLLSYCTKPLSKDTALQIMCDLGYIYCKSIGKLRQNILANCMAYAIANHNYDNLRILQKYSQENYIQIECHLFIRIAIEKKNIQLLIYCIENYFAQSAQISYTIQQIATSDSLPSICNTANLALDLVQLHSYLLNKFSLKEILFKENKYSFFLPFKVIRNIAKNSILKDYLREIITYSDKLDKRILDNFILELLNNDLLLDLQHSEAAIIIMQLTQHKYPDRTQELQDKINEKRYIEQKHHQQQKQRSIERHNNEVIAHYTKEKTVFKFSIFSQIDAMYGIFTQPLDIATDLVDHLDSLIYQTFTEQFEKVAIEFEDEVQFAANTNLNDNDSLTSSKPSSESTNDVTNISQLHTPKISSQR